MLFPSKYSNPELFKHLPEDTNAEESMHYKIYRHCGDSNKPLNFGLVDGLSSIVTFCDYFERRMTAAIGKKK